MATVLTTPRTSSHARTAPARTAAPAGKLRLTRRGRLTITLLALVVIIFGVVAGASSAFGRTAPTSPAPVVVQPGDTLWSLARAVNPSDDPRGTIDLLRELNGLSPDSPLVPGQRLILPSE